MSSRSTQQDGAPPILQTMAAIPLPTAAETDYKRLPKTPAGAYVTEGYLNPNGTGSANSAGSIPVNVGAKRLDPWGRLFLYCQWNSQQSPGTDASFSIISAGADGKLETTCLNNTVTTSSDDRIEYLTVASAMARSRTWQAQADNTYRFGVDASSSSAGRVVVGVDTAHDTDTSQQLNVGGNGKFGGNLTVTGSLATNYVNAAIVNASAVANTGDQSVGGKLSVSGIITNPGAANSGGVAVNDSVFAYNDTGTSSAVKMAGSGVSAQPELAAYATSGNIPIRLSSQNTGSVIFRTNNVDQMVVTGNGNVGIGTTTPNSKLDVAGGVQALIILNLSDRRLKDNIAPIKDPLEQIRKLRGVRFTWRHDGSKSVGVIAQEVEEVFPELVQTGANGIKAVMYANLVSPLIEAVKTLADKFDELMVWRHETSQVVVQLQAKMELLQANNTALEERLKRLESAAR